MLVDKRIAEIVKEIKKQGKRIDNLEQIIQGKKGKAHLQRKSISGHLMNLKSEGFFNQPKFVKEIVERLAQEGYHYPPNSLTWPLQKAVRDKILGRVKKQGKWAYCKR
jgi:hypothetical protein